MPEIIRIGEKMIDPARIERATREILRLRAEGASQLEVAGMLGVDRTFVSRLETLGEIRKGRRVALIGFPISNHHELAQIANSFGVEWKLLMTEEERWALVRQSSGVDLVNRIMEWVVRARACDSVVVIASNERIQMIEGLLGRKVFAISLGPSPITEDKYIEPVEISQALQSLMVEAN